MRGIERSVTNTAWTNYNNKFPNSGFCSNEYLATKL